MYETYHFNLISLLLCLDFLLFANAAYKKQDLLNMAIENVEPTQECGPEQLHAHGTARTKTKKRGGENK